MMKSPVLDRCIQHDGLAHCNMAVSLRQLDTQAQDLAAKGWVIDFVHHLRQGVFVHRAGISPGELFAGQ